MTAKPWRFQNWAFETHTGNPVRKAVLMMLAVMADSETGRCEAKQDTLAKGVEAGERSVRAHLKALEESGVIARRPQFRIDRGRRGDEYLLLAPWVTHWPDGQEVARVQPAGDAGGFNRQEMPPPPERTDTPPGVSSVPGKNNHLGTTSSTTGGNAPARQASNPDLPPDDFPSEWEQRLDETIDHLVFAASQRGAEPPSRGAVARAMLKRPDKPWEQVAERVAHWLVYGNGRDANAVDVVARWRQWCDKEPNRRIAGSAGLPASYVPPRRNGRPSVEEVLALKGTLDHLDRR